MNPLAFPLAFAMIGMSSKRNARNEFFRAAALVKTFLKQSAEAEDCETTNELFESAIYAFQHAERLAVQTGNGHIPKEVIATVNSMVHEMDFIERAIHAACRG